MSYELSTNVTSTDEIMQLGSVLAKSGYFQDARDASQAIVKVLAGREIGIGPVAAMTGIYIVKGRVTMSANLMAAQVKRSGKYNYRTSEMSNERVVIVFFEGGEEIGTSSFSAQDAKDAGLWGSSDPWKKTPRNMLFARAMSNGCKWFCPDVFSGPVYTPDELDGSAIVDAPPPQVVVQATGEIIEQPAQQVRPIHRAAKPVQAVVPAKKPPTREGMIARIKTLTDEAVEAGIDATAIAPPKALESMTEDELKEFGTVLRTAVDAAKEDAAFPTPDAE